MLRLIGLGIALGFLYRLTQYASLYFWPKRKLEELGKWAVITGPTDGIGKAYALRLAQTTKLNLMLIGRSQEKLDALKEELAAIKPEREIKLCCVDFDQTPLPLGTVKEQLTDLDVGLLINNVGVSYPGPMTFEMVTPKFVDSLIDVNVRSTMQMTHAVYAGMILRQRGAIVCLGSGSSVIADPLLAGYAGTKGAVDTFCRSLQAECRPKGVIVQCQIPLFVSTKMSKITKPSLTVPSPMQYADAGLRVIRGASGKGLLPSPVTLSPYPVHAVMLECISWVPSRLIEFVRMREQMALHARYMRKLASKEK